MPANYDMRCPIARTLDIVGDSWTILILRDLVVSGPRRFQDFERSLAGVSPNTLSARLKRLEEHGIVERRFYEQHPPRAEYVLTEKGGELRPVLRALLDWGRRHTCWAPPSAMPGRAPREGAAPTAAQKNPQRTGSRTTTGISRSVFCW